MNPITIALLLGVTMGFGAGFAATKQYYTAEIAIITAKQANSELAIANAYSDYIKMEQENYAKNQTIVAAAAASRVRVSFPVQRCADKSVPASAPGSEPAPASGAFQSDLGAAFEQFRRDVERDIVNSCDQLNIEVNH